jgi:hypothetical protein
MEFVNDATFGEMQYNHSWRKQQLLKLWGTTFDITIKAAAYKNQKITDEQRQSYSKFIKSIDEISKTSLKSVIDYINTNYKKCNEDEAIKSLKPNTILFKQDGSCGILCDFEYDIENGIVICIYPKYEMGPQDIFL